MSDSQPTQLDIQVKKMNDVMLAAAPLLLVLFGGVALMLVDGFSKEDPYLSLLSFVVLAVAGAVAACLLGLDVQVTPPPAVSRYLAFDKASFCFDALICLGSALIASIAGGYLREHALERGEFYPLIVFTTAGAMILARAEHLVALFLGLEIMSLGTYAMIGFRRTSSRALEGAIKYFLLGSFATAFLLLGMAFLYGATGSLELAEIARVVESGKSATQLLLLAMLLIFTGLGFKLSLVPFHMWTPDAYEGAATPVTAYMAVAVKLAVFASMLRIALGTFGDPLSSSMATGWPPVLAALAVASMVFGNLAAIVQSNLKRMLAYSSIAHAGYMLIGIVAAPQDVEAGASAVVVYALAYALSSVLAFGALVAFGSRGLEAVSYDDLAGAGRRHPLLALPFVLGVLSLMGFPPTAGFFGKYYIFTAVVAAGNQYTWLAVVGVVTSAMGAYYYLKVIVYLFMRVPREGEPVAVPMRSALVAMPLTVASIFVLQVGLLPEKYLDLAIAVAKQWT